MGKAKGEDGRHDLFLGGLRRQGNSLRVGPGEEVADYFWGLEEVIAHSDS
jgi:hypothetical protein